MSDHDFGTYGWWRQAAWGLLEPLIPLMRKGASQLELSGPPSDHDGNADRLEAYARPCLLAALWLQSEDDAATVRHKAGMANWFREALLLGTDPDNSRYWGPNANYHQNGVEMGLLVIALKAARSWLWDPLDPSGKEKVARWMASNRGTGHHWNNHLFFGIMALEFLADTGFARPTDEAAIDQWFSQMEDMYRGDGWFMDGMNQSYDHYNAYAFHFYAPVWAWLYGSRRPERAARWERWTEQFLQNYDHFFAVSGEHPAFGRSISYRFNATAPFAAAALAGWLSIPSGRARRLLSRNLAFFLDRPIFQEQGALSLGWHDPFPELAEKYSCAGSPYWAAKSFICLLIPPVDPFWNEPEEPMPSEEADFVLPLVPTGLIVRSIAGEVEILNAGTEITPVNKEKFGPWKWGKLAYRTGVGFCIGQSDDDYSRDMGLTVTGGRLQRTYGRHFTTACELSSDHLCAVYSLGDKHEQINTVVETRLWWKAGWLLQLHYYDNYQSMAVTLGGFALATDDPAEFTFRESGLVLTAQARGRETVLQGLGGSLIQEWDKRLDNTTPRSHVEAPWHMTPLLTRNSHRGSGWIAALCYAGQSGPDADPWIHVQMNSGTWQFQHPHLGDWQIQHPELPSLTPTT